MRQRLGSTSKTKLDKFLPLREPWRLKSVVVHWVVYLYRPTSGGSRGGQLTPKFKIFWECSGPTAHHRWFNFNIQLAPPPPRCKIVDPPLYTYLTTEWSYTLSPYLTRMPPVPQLRVHADQFCHSPSWQSWAHPTLHGCTSAGFTNSLLFPTTLTSESIGLGQWRAEGGGAGGAWPPGASLGGGARPACRGKGPRVLYALGGLSFLFLVEDLFFLPKGGRQGGGGASRVGLWGC